MLITTLFPAADARYFSPSPLRLPVPDWPDPKVNIAPQFVHFFGQAMERIRSPDVAWPDELKFIRARRALRFNNLELQKKHSSPIQYHLACAYRRMYSDGGAVIRTEIGLQNKKALALQNKGLSLNEILQVVKEVVEIPTLVPSSSGEKRARPLISQGKFLARLYAYATSGNRKAASEKELRLVEHGDPLILVELESDQGAIFQNDKYPGAITCLDAASLGGLNAIYLRLETEIGFVGTWIIQQGSATWAQLRSLRLCLNRIHAEREVLDIILKQIKRGYLMVPPDETVANQLDAYFNEKLKIINKNQWSGFDQSRITTAMKAADQVISPALREQLITRYEGSRRQVWTRIQQYQEERRATRLVKSISINAGGVMVEKQINVSGTGNIVNVAEYMSNVTNTVHNNLAAATASDEIVGLINDLNAELEKLSQNSDPAVVKKIGKNLVTLSNEVASEEPERRWYELSLEGMKEAAESLGAISGPIISIIGKLSTLLLV